MSYFEGPGQDAPPRVHIDATERDHSVPSRDYDEIDACIARFGGASRYLNKLGRHPHILGSRSSSDRSGSGPVNGVDGCWACECGNVNYPRRDTCHRCRQPRSKANDLVVYNYVRNLMSQRQKQGLNDFSRPVEEAPRARPPDKYKTRLCQDWRHNSCLKGAHCGYAHGEAELRTPDQHPEPIMHAMETPLSSPLEMLEKTPFLVLDKIRQMQDFDGDVVNLRYGPDGTAQLYFMRTLVLEIRRNRVRILDPNPDNLLPPEAARKVLAAVNSILDAMKCSVRMQLREDNSMALHNTKLCAVEKFISGAWFDIPALWQTQYHVGPVPIHRVEQQEHGRHTLSADTTHQAELVELHHGFEAHPSRPWSQSIGVPFGRSMAMAERETVGRPAVPRPRGYLAPTGGMFGAVPYPMLARQFPNHAFHPPTYSGGPSFPMDPTRFPLEVPAEVLHLHREHQRQAANGEIVQPQYQPLDMSSIPAEVLARSRGDPSSSSGGSSTCSTPSGEDGVGMLVRESRGSTRMLMKKHTVPQLKAKLLHRTLSGPAGPNRLTSVVAVPASTARTATNSTGIPYDVFSSAQDAPRGYDRIFAASGPFPVVRQRPPTVSSCEAIPEEN